MNRALIQSLIKQSLSDPSAAAARIFALKLSRDVLWSAFALIIVLNVLAAVLLTPAPPDMAGQPAELQEIMRMLNAPLLMTLVSGGVFVVLIFLLTWVGRVIGGSGDLGDMLAALTWLQFLTLLSRFIVIALLYVAPAMAQLALLAIWGLSLWITLHFIKVAHRFDHIGQALATFLLTIFGVALGAVVFLSVIGSLYKGFAG